MSLTFADTHNMVVYLNKSDASEGFNQVIDFLNGSYIKYALTANLTIYLTCIKQFWNIDVVKQSNDVTRLQALVDKKKVMITEATIRDALRLDDADGVDCLPNEIFVELDRMGYEKSSTKLTFYKAFFSSQWKFLIHTILQSMSAKRTSWNEFSSAMASAVICLSIGRKFNFSKYIFKSLVRNVDSSSKFYMHPRFIQLIIQNQLGDLSTHTTKYISPALTQKVFANMRRVGKGCSRVETPLFEGMLVAGEPEEQGNAEEQVQDNVDDAAQGADTDVSGDDGAEKKAEDTQVAGDEQVKGRQAEIYQIDMDHASKVLSMQEDEPEVQEVVDVVTTSKLITESCCCSTRRRKGVVIRDPEEESTAKTPAETKSKDKGKGIIVEEPKPMKKKQQVKLDEEYARKLHEELNKDIDWDVTIDHVKQKAKEDPYVQRYQVMKKRPQTEAQARMNMIMYLKNVVGFRLDYFKGMSYDDIHPIFEAKFNTNIKFLLKSKEEIEEEENIALESINETLAQKAAKRRKLNEEVEDLKQHLEIMPDEDDDVYT
nr:hypothetical protein [Tanacetum cinerariifolium]